MRNDAVYCEKCGMPLSILVDDLLKGVEEECTKCHHNNRWYCCTTCGNGANFSDFLSDGLCRDCSSTPIIKSDVDFVHKFVSQECPYCEYPIPFDFRKVDHVQCPQCKEVSLYKGTFKVIFVSIIYLTFCGYLGDKILDGFANRSVGGLVLIPFILMGGLKILFSLFYLEKRVVE